MGVSNVWAPGVKLSIYELIHIGYKKNSTGTVFSDMEWKWWMKPHLFECLPFVMIPLNVQVLPGEKVTTLLIRGISHQLPWLPNEAWNYSTSSLNLDFPHRHLSLIKGNRWKTLWTADTSVPGSKSESKLGSGVASHTQCCS